jgi:hypothetical protein
MRRQARQSLMVVYIYMFYHEYAPKYYERKKMQQAIKWCTVACPRQWRHGQAL